MVYTGKFAPLWNTLEMTQLPARLGALGVAAELHMVGDKVHEVPKDPSYADRMTRALESTPGVVWHGGMPRQDAMRTSAAMDIGLSWRDPSMDGSLELSTKVLEFGALDVPVVLNRTQMHEDLYGIDYPLFVQGEDDVVDAVATVAQDPELYAVARRRCREVSSRFSMDAAVVRMHSHLERTFPKGVDVAPGLGGRSRPLRVGIASHDLKFFSRMLDYLRALPEVEVRLDEWSALTVNDPASSEALLEWADVIIAEWCGPVAVWYSERKRPGQRLIVRLHRFELDGPWLKDVVIDNIDQLVCVSPWYAQLTAQRTGWPVHKIVVLPNWVDAEQMDRPKLDGAEFHLGMIGIAPMRKRLDLGLDVLEALRRAGRAVPRCSPSRSCPGTTGGSGAGPRSRSTTPRCSAGSRPRRTCAEPSCSTASAATSRPGCDASGGCCRPRTTRASTWHRPRGWRLLPCPRCCRGRAPTRSTTGGGSTPMSTPWPSASSPRCTKAAGRRRGRWPVATSRSRSRSTRSARPGLGC